MSIQRLQRHTLVSRSGGCGAALALVFAAGLAWADDVVLIAGSTVKQAIGGRVRGAVESESPSGVVVSLGASSVSVPIDQIASIRYDGQTATLQLAETRLAAGQLAEAAGYFKQAAGESTDKPFVLQKALYGEAAALADLALIEPTRQKEARDKLSRFVQSYPGSRHIIPAREALIRIQIASGDFPGAETTLTGLAKLPQAKDRAAVLRAKVLAKQGRHDEAISELDRLLAALPDRSTAQREAKLIKAESLVGVKKFKEAETLLEQVIQAAPPEDVATQSAAYNALGDCLRAANRPKDALLAYLHTDLLYSKDRQEHPRALFQIEKLFRSLKQDGRADEYAQRLRQEYPHSQWTSAK
ncbi:MAG: tetratricopeptide repeat protein [Isosphaeraceae bacterium]